MINPYHATFDPQDPMGYTYLITMVIWEGLPKTFSFFDNILEPIRVMADREVADVAKHFEITTLIVTKLQKIEPCV